MVTLLHESKDEELHEAVKKYFTNEDTISISNKISKDDEPDSYTVWLCSDYKYLKES